MIEVVSAGTDCIIKDNRRECLLELNVTGSAEDAYVYDTSTSPCTTRNTAASANYIGNGTYRYNAFARFNLTGLEISLSDVTINNATYKVYGYGSAGSPLTKVYAENKSNPIAPTSCEDTVQRNRTTANVDWNVALTDNVWVALDVTPIIQELADTIDPTAIVILHDDNGSVSGGILGYRSWDYGNPEQLIINYTEKIGLEFVNPSDANATTVNRNWTYINLSVTNYSAGIDTFIINWNGSNETISPNWTSPTGVDDPDNIWNNDANAYDEDTETFASYWAQSGWSSFLELTLSDTITSNKTRFYVVFIYPVGNFNRYDLDIYNDDWVNASEGSVTASSWNEVPFTKNSSITKARIRFNLTQAEYVHIAEFDFYRIETYHVNKTNLAEGTYTYYAYVNDTDGNSNTTEERTITIDTVSPAKLYTCQNLDAPDFIYELANDVSSSGTCFTIGANNVTLDCKGYLITYSSSIGGVAVNNTGREYTKIKNCRTIQGTTNIANNHGIYFESSGNGTIVNNTIVTRSYGGAGAISAGVYLDDSSNNVIANNTINSTAGVAYGIYLVGTPYHNLIDRNIITMPNTGYAGGKGIQIYAVPQYNNITNNIIKSSVNYAAVSCTYCYNLRFINNTITTSGTGSNGISLTAGNNNALINNTITTTGSGSEAILFDRIDDTNITNCNLSATFEGTADLMLDDSERIGLINTNYTDIGFDALSDLKRYWYLDVYVEDSNNNALSGVNITVFDSLNNRLFDNTTQTNGYIPQHIVLEYNHTNSSAYFIRENMTNTVFFTNYTINATKSGYDTLVQYPNVTASTELTFTLTAVVAGDTTIPIINGTLNKSISSIYQYNIINATFNATDDSTNLTNGTIITNESGIWQYYNFTFITSGQQEFSQNFSVSGASGTIINVTGLVYDNSSNFAINDTLITVTTSDTCTYSSGDWNINCADNCILNTNTDVNGNNIFFYGTGTAEIMAEISGYKHFYIGDQTNACHVVCRHESCVAGIE